MKKIFDNANQKIICQTIMIVGAIIMAGLIIHAINLDLPTKNLIIFINSLGIFGVIFLFYFLTVK